jgi:gamma-glutamyltranspeptidase/glutathione hydrolase
MGDFNAAPEMTTDQGFIGTKPNLAEPGKRMLSSMAPTILAKDSKLFMVTGSPGGRTIINTVLETIVDAVDFGMNAQEAVDAARFHHQWLPDEISYEKFGFSPDTIKDLERRGQVLREERSQGVAQVIIYDQKNDVLEGGNDRRSADGAAVGVIGRLMAGTGSAGGAKRN